MSSKQARIWTSANVVTVVRIVFVPMLMVVMLAPWEQLFGLDSSDHLVKPLVSTALFLILSATDGVDGYLARSRNEVTDFGKFMDPLADKLLVIAPFLALTEIGILPSWVSFIVLFREFMISGLRMLAASKGTVIAASWYGKAKTVTQMIAISLFLITDAIVQLVGPAAQTPAVVLSWIALILSLILALVSLGDYFLKSRALLFAKTEPEAVLELSSEIDSDLPCVSYEQLKVLATKTLEIARQKGVSLGTAESLTGGLISASFTAIPGSSDTFVGGVASYMYQAKERVLGVSESYLSEHGAVEESVALQMALGAKNALACDFAVSVTGIAGPGGEEPGKPVGTVWMAVSGPQTTFTQRFCFTGTRDEVRCKTVAASLLALQQELLEY